MNLPILDKLKAGEKFDFATLADNIEQTEEFWHWWWAEKADPDYISRPEIIEDNEPVLVETLRKPTVDFAAYPEFFDRHLVKAIQANLLPPINGCVRENFRAKVKWLLRGGSATTLAGQPQIVFAGGGYGSGKTTTLNHLAEAGLLPLEMRHMVGVDIFKPFIPEYQWIKAVGDGRASLTVQKECQEMASELFEELISARRSFMWDSSMSDKEPTLERIRSALDAGYSLMMIAVLTPLKAAIRQAMHRACLTRRFPHPDALPKSHRGFRAAFNDYVPLFEKIRVFANVKDEGAEHGTCYEIAVKEAGENALAIMDEPMFRLALSSSEDLPYTNEPDQSQDH